MKKNSIVVDDKIVRLFYLYKNLLSKKIKQRMEYYIEEDYSLTEIASIDNVSKQSVYESILTGFKELDKYEDILKFSDKLDKAYSLIESNNIETNKKEILDKLIDIMEG